MQPLIDRQTWKRLLAKHVVPIYQFQDFDPERFDTMADATFEALRADKWTVPQTAWCVREMVRHYRRLDNLLAMLMQVNEGRTDPRTGETWGGWRQSDTYRKLQREEKSERDACVAAHLDQSDRSCGRRSFCVGCSLAPARHQAARGRHGLSDSVGGLEPIGKVVKEVLNGRLIHA